MFGWFKKKSGGSAEPKKEAGGLAAAIALHVAGELASAVARYEGMVDPSSPAGAPGFLLATAYLQLGRPQEAVALIQRITSTPNDIALEIEAVTEGEEVPAIVEASLAAGETVKGAGRPDVACAFYRMAASLAPRSAEPLYRFGDTMHDLRQYEQAEEALQAAIAVDPSHWGALYSSGVLNQDLGRLEEALLFYERALLVRDDYAKLHNNLGSALHNLERASEAVPYFLRAIELDPTLPFAHANLGTAYDEVGEWRKARGAFDDAIAAGAGAGIMVRRALVQPTVPQSKEEIAEARSLMQGELQEMKAKGISLTDPIQEVSKTPFYLAYQGLDDLPLLRQLADFYSAACPPLNFVAPHCTGNGSAREGKIRVGFISTYLYNHTIGHYFNSVIKNLDRDAFEVVVLSNFAKRDALSEAIAQSADDVVVVPPNLAGAQQAVAAARLDLLVFADIGMEPLTYFLAFSRLAPVQVALYGHPVTSGIPAIDYFLTHEECELPDAQSHYSERLLYLSKDVTYTYFQRPAVSPLPRSRGDFGISEKAHVYLCPQSLFKIHPDMDGLFAEILNADPDGLLLLWEGRQQHWQDLLAQRLKNASVDMDRVRFLQRMPYGDFLEVMRHSDVVLDTVHFSGGATTFDALAMGTPIVTLPGAFMRGRQTYACYRRMGIADCIAENAAEYVGKSVKIASDQELRAELSGRIKAAAPMLYEDLGMIKEFEALLKQAVL